MRFPVYRGAAGEGLSLAVTQWLGGKQRLTDGIRIMVMLIANVGPHGLWESLRTLLRAWWGSDRIRTFPTTGRILALRPGDRFLLMDQIWTVTLRDIKCGESTARVRLGISSEIENESAELIVDASDVRSAGVEPARLRIDGRMIPVWDVDFSLLPSNTFAGQ